MNAVEFDCVSKSYAIYESPGDRLKELLTLRERSFHRDFWALRDLSFSIRRGEVFCIVGENGSGKSTALQLMAGIMQPSTGEVRVAGRVAALLELGAGFNPEFSGRDNVYLNGSIMGLSGREIDRRYKDIEEFAEIGEFISQPVKTYSSGMVVRLAFAVAINIDPEVLIVDEALAVGDTYFRHRCMRKIHELRARGITIVFVSHSAAEVKAIGDRVLWLKHGRAAGLGNADEILSQYLAAMFHEPAHKKLPGPPQIKTVETIPNIDHRYGDGRARVLGIAILNEYEEALHLMMPGMRIIVRISVEAEVMIPQPGIGFVLRNHLGIDFAETNTSREGQPLSAMRPRDICTIDFHIDMPEFYPGAFSFSPFITEGEVCDWIDNAITVQMGKGEGPVYGYIQLPCRIEFDAPLTSPEAPDLESTVA